MKTAPTTKNSRFLTFNDREITVDILQRIAIQHATGLTKRRVAQMFNKMYLSAKDGSQSEYAAVETTIKEILDIGKARRSERANATPKDISDIKFAKQASSGLGASLNRLKQKIKEEPNA